MPALFGEDLILDVDGGNAVPLELTHGANHVELVAEASIGIGDDGKVDHAGDPARIADHLAHRQQSIVGITVTRRGAGSGHVHDREAGMRDQRGRDAVIGARRDRHAFPPDQVAQLFPSAHDGLH